MRSTTLLGFGAQAPPMVSICDLSWRLVARDCDLSWRLVAGEGIVYSMLS